LSNKRRFSVESSLQHISSIFLLWNETIRRYLCKCDFEAANLRPAIEHVCGKQTRKENEKFIFPSDFAICSQYQNIEKIEIWVGALCGYLRKENCCAMPTSDVFCGRNTFFSENVAVAQRFSFRKYPKSASI